MAATGHCAVHFCHRPWRDSYAVHYASSCPCPFEWRFHAYYCYCVLLTRERLNRRASHSKRSAVVRMTNLRNGISKRFHSYSCYTALQTCFVRIHSKSRVPLFPLRRRFLSLIFTKNSIVRFSSRNYFILRVSAQHHRLYRRRIASHTAPFTVSLHSTNCQKFLQGFPPTTSFNKFISSYPRKRKLLNTTVAPFCRRTAHKNRRTSKFCTHQFTVRGRGTQRTTLSSQKLAPK